MGVYLSSPVTEKESVDEDCKNFCYGASSMQGWRITQEDAHNCIPEFDPKTKTSFFAVYDGHGGSEVAKYCETHFPDFIKLLIESQENHDDPGKIIKSAFLAFDATLTQEEVVKELKVLSGKDEDDEDEDPDDPLGRKETEKLKEEADMPLEELLAKYGKKDAEEPSSSNDKNDNEAGPSSSKPGPSAIRALKEGDKRSDFLSPALRAKGKSRTQSGGSVSNETDDEPSSSTSADQSTPSKSNPGSSSSAAAASSSQISSSSSSSSSSSNGAMAPSSLSNGHENGKSSDNTNNGESQNNNNAKQSESLAPDSSSSSSEVKSAGKSSGSSAVKNDSAGVSSSASGGSSAEAGGSGDAGGSGSGVSASGMRSSKVKAKEVMALENDLPDSDDDDDSEDEAVEDMWEDDSEEEDDDDEEEDDEDSPTMDMTNEEPGSDSGCTACVVMLQENKVIVANAGDSRCVMSRDGKAVELSFDHKPEDDPERERIEKAGGKVTADGRVNGGLNLSRAIGDHVYKRTSSLPAREQMITALPDIETADITDKDEFIVIACDGIWNYLSSQETIDYVREKLKDPEKRKNPSKVCEELFDHCLAPNTYGDGTGCDNMTCIIVVLKSFSGNEHVNTDNNSSTEISQSEASKAKQEAPLKRLADTVSEGQGKKQKVGEEAD